jgi:hypothetical protein
MRLRQINENNLQVSEICCNFAASKQKEMYKTIEIEMYKDLRDWVEEIAYFTAKEIEERAKSEDSFYVEFLDDCLELMMDLYNCRHVYSDILSDLRMACEREIWDRCVYGKPLIIVKNRIYFEKNS